MQGSARRRARPWHVTWITRVRRASFDAAPRPLLSPPQVLAMIRTSRRSTVAALAVSLVSLVSLAGTAQAQAYTGPISGTTTGCFHATGNPASCAASSSASLAGLQFAGVTNGSFGSIANGGGSIVLGTLTLSPNRGNSTGLFDGSSFSLFASFAQPGGSDTFVAALDGIFFTPMFFGGQLGALQVSQLAGGPRTVSYGDASGSGSFVIDIDDSELLTINLDNTATIRATISDATFAAAPTVTPEPATVALLATGLAAMGGIGAARRRRTAA